MIGAATGMSYKEILKELVKKGEISQEDLKGILRDDEDEDDGTGKSS